MNTRNVLFIVEGKTDEPEFIKCIYNKCFSDENFNIYSYKTNLHVLAAKLENDYPEFDEDEIDIQLLLRSYETNQGSLNVLSKKYTDIFLIFDFEPQDNNFNKDTIRKMLLYFNDSTNNGKLFINYPMMQSYKDIQNMPDYLFLEKRVAKDEFKTYKYLVGNRSNYTNLNLYTNVILISLVTHHLIKANYILNGKPIMMNYYDYDKLNYLDLFDIQCDNLKNGFVYVINTSIFLIVDYNPTVFFNRIKKHKSIFDIPK